MYESAGDWKRFAAYLRHLQETTIAGADDWRIRYENERYVVECASHLKGIFQTAEEALNIIPEFFREIMRKQMKHANQLTLF